MNKFVIALMGCTLAAGHGVVAAEGEVVEGAVVTQPIAWQSYKNAKVGFEITLPAKPHVEETVGDKSDEFAIQHSLVLTAKDEQGASIQLYAVSYSFEIPKDSTLMTQTRDVIVKSLAGHGKIVRDEAFTVNGLAGHNVVMEEDHGDVTTVMDFRVLTRGKVMYQMYISGVKGGHFKKVADTAVESFKALK